MSLRPSGTPILLYPISHNLHKLIVHPTDTEAISGIVPYPIADSSYMESCRLPIELCEAVMSALRDSLGRRDGVLDPRKTWESQQGLCACALTCRAWHVRAQYLLWTFPHISNVQHLTHFITALRRSSNISNTHGLVLGRNIDHSASILQYGFTIRALPDGGSEFISHRPKKDDSPTPDLSTAGELFIRPFPHLQRLLCVNIRFDNGPPLPILRMRLPFFVTITDLQLQKCTFGSFRAMLDVVWACPNLATLDIDDSWFKSHAPSIAVLQQMSAAAEHLRACRRLTALRLDGHVLQASPSFLPYTLRLLTA